MSQSPDFDASLERLRAIGSVKWSQHPDAIGAFVAEMDFGTAAPIAAALHEAVDLGQLGYLPDRLAARMSQAWSGYARERLRLGRAARAGPAARRRGVRAGRGDRALLPARAPR